jgi:hypothetical protein
MTFPSSGPGYPQQGGQPHQPSQPGPGAGPFHPSAPGGTVGALNLGVLLALVVAVLGVVEYFIGFSDEAAAAQQVTLFLLIGGLLAAMRLLPNGPRTIPFAALFSVLGALEAIDLVIGVPSQASTPGIITVIMILGILQLLAAVAALLFDYNVLKAPAAKPAQSQAPYGQQQFGQPGQGQFGQPSQFGQAPAQGEQAGPFSQPTKFNPPVAPPGQQATQYAPQQGQFYGQQQSPESGQQQPPGTPPGGFDKQS